eukprot:2753862-Heterocapsa_arctica.AAC.1
MRHSINMVPLPTVLAGPLGQPLPLLTTVVNEEGAASIMPSHAGSSSSPLSSGAKDTACSSCAE